MSLQKQVLGGAFWSLTGQFGFMLIGLITNVVLARMLSPFEFGQMSILMFFILISSVFTEGGLGGALIRKKEVTNDDYSTAFVFNLGVSVFFFILLFFLSGPISAYYNDGELKHLLIASSSILLVGAVSFTQNTKLVRDLQFKKIALIQLISISISSVVSIYLGVTGAGVWALLLFQIITPLLVTSFQLIFGGTFYPIRFNKASFKQLYGFGLNTSLTSIISIAFDNIYPLVLGRYFSINQAGFFYQAKRLQDVPVKVFSNMTHGVVFSSLAKIQDQRARFIIAYNRVTLLITILMAGIFSFVILYADSIIWLLYGEQWMEAAFFMKLLGIGSFFYFQDLLSLLVFKVFNQTRKNLYIEIFKKVVQSFSIFVGIYYLNISYLLYGFVISSIISYLLNYYHSRKILGEIKRRDFLVIVMVILSCVISVTICKSLILALMLSEITSLVLIPIFIFLFFLSLNLMRVVDLKNEFNSFVKLIKKDKSVSSLSNIK